MSKLANTGVETALPPITRHHEIAADVNDIRSFADYLAERLPTLSIHLKIRKSRFCGGVDKNLYGIADATAAYDWKSSWSSDDRVVESQDWTTTKASILKLRCRLKKAVESLDDPNDKNIIAATRSILEWGGNRRWDKGAYEFLLWLAEQNYLRKYLRKCKSALSLQSNDPSNLNAVMKMNSMLTKVHSILAEDGLPIYDSRVAVAIAILAEQYRRDAGLSYLPKGILFPTVDASPDSFRHVDAVYFDAVGAKRLYYLAKDRHTQWTLAKWKLGKLMHLVLNKNESLFHTDGNFVSRCHAFEAALFMLGYDGRCLRP